METVLGRARALVLKIERQGVEAVENARFAVISKYQRRLPMNQVSSGILFFPFLLLFLDFLFLPHNAY
jgi:hypothetical protein